MSNVFERKVFIQIESASEQQEHLKNQRKTLKVLQGVATDKENLTGRTPIDKLIRLKALTDNTLATPEIIKRKKIDTRPAETQTTPAKNDAEQSKKEKCITIEDLTETTASPSGAYWERLAEKRGEALEEALHENQRLHERIDGLEEELSTSRQMLEEARNLVDVLTEMLSEKDVEDEEEGEKCSSDTTSVTDQADEDVEKIDAEAALQEKATSTTDDANDNK